MSIRHILNWAEFEKVEMLREWLQSQGKKAG